MPVAPNPLLQSGLVNAPSRSSVSAPDKATQAPASLDGGFDKVMARQARDNVPARDDKAAQAKPKDKPDVAQGGKKPEDKATQVADGGNDLPAKGVSETAEADESSSLDASLVAGQVTEALPGGQLLQAQAEAVAPVLEAAVQQAVVAQQPAVAQQPLPPAAAVTEEVPAEAFDPEADPLANLPTLRLALEQNAQAKGVTSAHASTSSETPAQQQAASNGQGAVNTLANLADQPQADAGQSEHGEKAFTELLGDGLKDVKGAASDTRVDDFANRLANLTQAVTPKTANAVPPTNPLHQPLQMNQGAWSEGLVNRVMYLSSQNLKSADIQLEPAELGRLDIRVNVATDQSTQVTFISGHAGVREALDNQAHRLRELFAQQGLAQPDVNVADQSREQRQQQAQQGDSNFSGVAARRAEEGGDADELADASRPVERQTVIGDSAIDYYA
ncbi:MULTISPECIES: flagellar hook-length control protein FliK [unclassified Pseudomonas]|uniref:flagellar hook-length control protein FliK n=1 Tax=unclassified Pseudomonas TaxID=196821 RepID=UPI0035BEE2E3